MVRLVRSSSGRVRSFGHWLLRGPQQGQPSSSIAIQAGTGHSRIPSASFVTAQMALLILLLASSWLVLTSRHDSASAQGSIHKVYMPALVKAWSQRVTLERAGWMTISNGDDVRALAREGDFIWAGTYAGGALRWDPATGAYTQYLSPQHPLAGNQVRDIAIDQAGNRWFATNRGLSRLSGDGTWTTFTVASTGGGLPSDNVTAVAVSPNGEVWAGTRQMVRLSSQYSGREYHGGGVARLRPGGSWSNWTAPLLASNNVTDIVVEPGTGNVWVATESYRYWIPPAFPGDTGAWGIQGGGVSLWSNGRWTSYQRNPTDPASYPTHNTVLAVAIDGAGRKWFATWGGSLNVLQGNTWSKFADSDDGLAGRYVRAVAVDRSGQVWSAVAQSSSGIGGGVSVLNHNGTIFDLTDDVWTHYTSENGLASDTVASMLADPSGILWFGTSDHKGNGRGISRLNPATSEWTTYATAPMSLRGNQITAIGSAPDGSVWFGTGDLKEVGRGRGLSILHPDGTWTHMDSKSRSRGAQVTTVTAHTPAGSTSVPVGFTSRSEADGALATGLVMFGDDPTVYEYVTFHSATRSLRVEPGLAQPVPAGTPVYAVNRGPASDNVSDIAFDAQGRAWVGFRQDVWDPYNREWLDGGLCVLETTGWKCYNRETSDLPSNNVAAVAVEPPGCGGRIWVGMGSLRDYSGFGLCSLDPATGRGQCYTYPLVASDNITDISVDPSTCAVWIAAAPYWSAGERRGGGVSVLNGDRWTKLIPPACHDNDVRVISVDPGGVVWAGCYHYTGTRLSLDWPYVSAAINRWDGRSWTWWTFPNQGWIAALAVDKQGLLWAGTSRGRETPDLAVGGAYIFDGENWIHVRGDNFGLPGNAGIQAITLDPAGSAWIGTIDQGVVHYSPGDPRQMGPGNLPPQQGAQQ